MIQIGRGGREDETSAGGLLRGCHRRIRHFAALATRLAESPDARPEEIADAAASIHRYFTIALPLHHEDEESSIRPRLPQTPELARALTTMHEQHDELETRLSKLVPVWDRLAREPATVRDLATELRDATAGFEAACEVHLQLEEAEIIPAVDALPATERDAIRAEMRERRA